MWRKALYEVQCEDKLEPDGKYIIKKDVHDKYNTPLKNRIIRYF